MLLQAGRYVLELQQSPEPQSLTAGTHIYEWIIRHDTGTDDKVLAALVVVMNMSTYNTCPMRVCPPGDGGDGADPAGAGLHLLLQGRDQREGERRPEDLLRPHGDEPLALPGEPHGEPGEPHALRPHCLAPRPRPTASSHDPAPRPHAMASDPAEPAACRDCVCFCRSLCPVPYYAHTLGCSHTQSSAVGEKPFFVNVCVVLTLDLFGNYFSFL